jgi:hypothetical protein
MRIDNQFCFEKQSLQTHFDLIKPRRSDWLAGDQDQIPTRGKYRQIGLNSSPQTALGAVAFHGISHRRSGRKTNSGLNLVITSLY